MTSRKRIALVLALFVAGVGISLALERLTGSGARARDGREGAPAAPPRRIVATAPNVVESLFALGAGERVAGVGDWCVYPPEAAEKPRIGGEVNPNFERILSLKPDLIIVQGRAENLDAFCRRFGIPLLRVHMADLASIYAGLRRLGRAVGCEAEADRLAARIRLDLANVAQRVAGRPRPRVFLCHGREAGSLRSLFSAGGKTFLSQVLDIAGGDNVLSDVEQPYPQVSKESLLHRAPDVVIEFHPGQALTKEKRRESLDDWQSLSSLPAVRKRRIHVLTDDYLLIPGPRVARVAARLAEVLHPEAGGSDE